MAGEKRLAEINQKLAGLYTTFKGLCCLAQLRLARQARHAQVLHRNVGRAVKPGGRVPVCALSSRLTTRRIG